MAVLCSISAIKITYCCTCFALLSFRSLLFPHRKQQQPQQKKLISIPPNNNNNMTSPIIVNNNDDDDQAKKDSQLIEEATIHLNEERLLEAARLLRQVQNKPSLLTKQQYKILDDANIIEQAVNDLLTEPDHNGDGNDDDDSGWKKQGESSSRSKYETTIYNKLQDGAKLTCRMETPVPSDLLIPLLSVLNESSLYHTWIPSWKRPFAIGVKDSKQLYKSSRGHQVIQVQCDVPWPMKCREVLMDVIAVDDIAHQGFIIAKMRTLKDDDSTTDVTNNDSNNNSSPQQPSTTADSGFQIPPCPSNMERVEFDGALLFRQCPIDHPHYESSKLKFGSDKDIILLQYTVYFDAHMSLVPTTMINFVTRTVIGHVWNMLLRVAEQVRDGTRIEHCQLIEGEKSDFYDWVKQRCEVMLHGMQQQQQKDQEDNPNSPSTQPVSTASRSNTISNIAKPFIDEPSDMPCSNHVADSLPSIIVTTNSSTSNNNSNDSNNKLLCNHHDKEIEADWTLKDVLRMSL